MFAAMTSLARSLSTLPAARSAVGLLPAAGLLLLLAGCVPPQVPTSPWLPDAAGWSPRRVDDAEPARWVIYERDALIADVKEFRIVALLDADPAAAMRALRFRLLDEQYVPDDLDRTILEQSDAEVLLYGRTPLPFPFRDREATERLRFAHHAQTGIYRVDAELVDPGGEPPEGVIRAPAIQNAWILEPTADGRTVPTVDTVHDIGDPVLNRMIYGPVCNGLVADLDIIEGLARSMEG